jgi:polysaccharide pyruvyl transferase WcaK-like protein
MKVLLLGSYNGQDSLGDKGLLSSVASQLQHHLGGHVEFISHVATTEPGFSPPGIEFKSGAWQIMGSCIAKTSMLAFWPMLRLAGAFALIPIWLAYQTKNRTIWREFRKDCRQCGALYFYGGTQLSTQWFDLNLPSILLTVLVFRLHGKPVYFGPQQYGPLSHRQRRWLKWILRYLVTDYRTRNEKCLELLAAPQDKLTLDEIYCCTSNYPAVAAQSPGRYLLVNYRGINFLDNYNSEEVNRFCTIVQTVSRALDLPIKVIQMSGASFCDDSGITDKLRLLGLNVELIPHTHNELDIIAVATNAAGAISMSFHGCILAMLAGRPAVPVTSGQYYDHKYVDFDRYTGGQGVPLVALRTPNSDEDKILKYFDSFSSDTLRDHRVHSAAIVSTWYDNVAKTINATAG